MRTLTENERRLLHRVLAATDGANELRRQVDGTVVVDEAISTFLDLKAPETEPPSALPDGPVPGVFLVKGVSGETTGEVLVWVKDGRLVGLEHAWVTDVAPGGMPSPGSVTTDESRHTET